MSRLPIDVLAARKKPAGRAGIWSAIRHLRRFTPREIAETTEIPLKTVQGYVEALLAGDFIGPVGGPAPSKAGEMFELLKDSGIETPRLDKHGKLVTQGAAREQMWRTIKMIRGDFSPRELAAAASLENSPVSETDAKSYLLNLHKAGYVTQALQRRPAQARYRFIPAMNTGPRPPMVQRMKTIFDPNLNRVVWHPEVEA